jgi:CRP/FNR family cyclic AMP-dependent transcriptional regulator
VAETGFARALQGNEQESLVRRGTRRRFPRGAHLFFEGERSDHVTLIVSGRVKIAYVTRDGKEVVLAIRGAGELLGELSAIDGEPRSAEATAIETVDAVIVPAHEFRAFLQDHPRVALVLLEMLSRRLRDADRKRIEFGEHDSVGRVARRLVEMAQRFGEAEGSGVRIALPLSQEELAGWTGSSRESVAKALGVLRQRGWIETGRRRIVVLDIESLKKRAT